MAEAFKIVYTGNLLPGTDREAFIDAFSSRLGVSAEEAAALADAGREVVMKKGLNAEDAAKYKKLLQKLGMEIEVVPVETADGTDLVAEAEDDGPRCPKCSSSRIQDDSCLECGIIISKYLARQQSEAETAQQSDDSNPYQAPAANITPEPGSGEIRGPETVPAGHGWLWIKQAYRHFRRNPVAWILALVVWIVISMVLSLVPVIGSLATTLLSPVIAAGFMIGCRAQDHGEDFTVNHLFSAFQQNFGQLVLVGGLYLMGMVIIFIGIFSVLGLSMVELQEPGASAQVVPDPTSMILPVAVAMLFFFPLLMAYWFAPALVALDGVSAVTAMKLSFIGCLKNILPFLVYGLATTVLGLLAAIPFFLGLLVFVPVITASIYTGYRDIYFD